MKTDLKTMESMEQDQADGQSDEASRIDGGTSGVHTAGDGQSDEVSRIDAEPSMYPYIVIRLPRMDLPVLSVS